MIWEAAKSGNEQRSEGGIWRQDKVVRLNPMFVTTRKVRRRVDWFRLT